MNFVDFVVLGRNVDSFFPVLSIFTYLLYSLSSLIFYILTDFLMLLFLKIVEREGLKSLMKTVQFFIFLSVLSVSLFIFSPLSIIKYVYVKDCHVLLINWPLHYCETFFLIPGNIPCDELDFILFYYIYTNFLLFTVWHMCYLFFFFLPVYIFI